MLFRCIFRILYQITERVSIFAHFLFWWGCPFIRPT